jgi:hypothetical protein
MYKKLLFKIRSGLLVTIIYQYLQMYETLQLFTSFSTLNTNIFMSISYLETHMYTHKSYLKFKLIQAWLKLKLFVALGLMKITHTFH